MGRIDDWVYDVYCRRLRRRKTYQWIRVFADTPTNPETLWWLFPVVKSLWESRLLWAILAGLLFLALSKLHYHFPNYQFANSIIPEPSFWTFITGVICIACTPVLLLFCMYRRRAKIEFEFHKNCHRLFHVLRNKYCKAMEKECDRDEKLGLFSLAACNEIDRFFSKLLNKQEQNEIGCCIRIASKSNRAYETIGRSETVSETRSQTTRPLPKDAGVAKAMLKKIKKNESSVLLVSNITAQDIEKDGIWSRLQGRNKNHCDDDPSIQSQLICPINCRESEVPITIGILYITSSRKNFMCPFKHHHGEIMAAIADVLGCLYQQTLKTEI